MATRRLAETAKIHSQDRYEATRVPFLSTLNLGNFKSIKSCNLGLAPLTILVGRNSSGKSTLIQSILLLAQNASAQDPRGLGETGSLDMNGSLITLGQFSELINDKVNDSDRYISVGCKFKFPIPPRGRWLELLAKDEDEDLQNQDKDLWSTAQNVEPLNRGCDLEFSIKFEENSNEYEKNLLKVREASTKFSINGENVQEIYGSKKKDMSAIQELEIDERFDFNFASTVKTWANLKNRKGIHNEPKNYLVYPNKLETRNLEATQFILGNPITGLEFMNTLDIVMKHQNQLFSNTRRISSEILRGLRLEHGTINEIKSKSLTNDEMNRLFELAVEAYARKCIEVAITITDLKWGSEEFYSIEQELIPLSTLDIPVKKYFDDSPGIHSYFEEDKGLFSKQDILDAEAEHELYLLSELGYFFIPYQMTTNEMGQFRASIHSSINLFWEKVKTRVGELRKSDQFQHKRLVPTGFALSEDLSDFDETNSLNLAVGFAVQRFREYLKKLSYLGPLRKPPTEIYERFSTQVNAQTPLGLEGERLGQLVFENQIALYPVPIKDLKSDFIVTETKKCSFRDALNAWLLELGIAREGITSIPESHYGLKVKVDGRPLRSLGVGVSQVIPVIATCLVASRGSLVLLEEPELHLNPSLQRKLADFFIAMTLPGADRQLIIETHSEYLITRLRVHSVSSKENASLIKLLFASQTKEAGESYSTYVELIPDENGEIPEWPELPGHEDGYFGQVPHDIQQLLRILIERHKNSVNSTTKSEKSFTQDLE